MTTTDGEGRCKYCWRPNNHRDPRYPGVAHNEGCPESVPAGEHEKRLWEAGYAYGFDDNYIVPWRYRFYTNSFLLGYQVGKAEIDQLVEEAVEARNSYDERD